VPAAKQRWPAANFDDHSPWKTLDLSAPQSILGQCCIDLDLDDHHGRHLSGHRFTAGERERNTLESLMSVLSR